MPEKYQCPACQQFKDVTLFTARPVDERCDVCLPVDQAMVAMDKKVQLAHDKMAAIFDAVEKGQSLGPIERVLQAGYEAFGGEHQLMLKWAECVNNLMDTNKYHAAAQNIMSFFKLHAKVDHMRMEDDWRNMDDAKVEATLQRKMKALMAKMERDEAETKTIEGLVQS
jgi:hypothetical protein